MVENRDPVCGRNVSPSTALPAGLSQKADQIPWEHGRRDSVVPSRSQIDGQEGDHRPDHFHRQDRPGKKEDIPEKGKGRLQEQDESGPGGLHMR